MKSAEVKSCEQTTSWSHDLNTTTASYYTDRSTRCNVRVMMFATNDLKMISCLFDGSYVQLTLKVKAQQDASESEGTSI